MSAQKSGGSFRTKLIVALILIPPLVLIWWLGAPYFNLLLFAFAGLAADEVVAMGAGRKAIAARAAAVTGALAVYASIGFATSPWSTTTAIVAAIFLCFVAQLARPGAINSAAPTLALAVFAVLYAGLPIAFLTALRAHPVHGRGLAFMTMAMAWLCDTFAYFGGRFLGRHKLYPLMSPNKTVEGLVTGMLAAAAAGALSTAAFHLPLSLPAAAVLGLVAGAWGQVGDLAESLLKRSYGVKDSGSLIPGHGGVLDRFDAIMFVAPLVYFAFALIAK
jgi:phosphatidate cytidylyltransferase